MLNFYDFEVWPKFWCCTIINPFTGEETVVVNDPQKLTEHYKAHKHEIYVGFNNRQYDDWIFKGILSGFDPWPINDFIINKNRKGWEYSRLLMKVKLNTFDCMVGFNGLKTLEAFLGMDIRESTIPFNYDGSFTPKMIDDVLFYNRHDVLATIAVFMERKSEFDSYMGLVKLFNLPLSYLSKSKAQLSAAILGAHKTPHINKDEFDVSVPPTLRIQKYTAVVDYFQHDWNYDTKLEIEIAGVPHVYGTGGIHGAISNYYGEGDYLHIDVNSYYPSLMIRYPEFCMSRSGASLARFTEIKESRIKYKKQKNPMADALKVVINGTYGAMKDVFNPLYDPRSANNVCIFGQLLLTDLIEKLEGHCDLIQSNTDGLIVKCHNNEEEVRAICAEWENRTGMSLGYDKITKVVQKDVNNYLAVFDNGKIESKGAYVKKLNKLDYDLPIVNDAVVNCLLYDRPVEDTINSCTELVKFQKVVKVSSKYKFAMHNGKRLHDTTFRVFASTSTSDTYIGKCKTEGATIEKFAYTPDKCFIENGDITNVDITNYPLDRSWYINLANKRIQDFLGR
jgi:hypothetical protein